MRANKVNLQTIYLLTITINLNLVAVVHEFWAVFRRRDLTNSMKLCDIAPSQRMQHKGKLQGKSPSSCKKLKTHQSKMSKTNIFKVLRNSNYFRNLITFYVNKSFDEKIFRWFLNRYYFKNTFLRIHVNFCSLIFIIFPQVCSQLNISI